MTSELIRAFAERDPGPSRDSIEDVLDDVFGRSYSREMKGILRGAFREGLALGGITDPELLDALVDEKAIDKLWATQKQYTTHIKNDLKYALTSKAVTTTDELEGWFTANDYRPQLTGRFMAWQGLNAGTARAADQNKQKVRWVLGHGVEEHCAVCLSRADRTYTYEDIIAIGPPGSDATECKARCACRLVPV